MAFTFCTNCGKRLDESVDKCPYCGHPKGAERTFYSSENNVDPENNAQNPNANEQNVHSDESGGQDNGQNPNNPYGQNPNNPYGQNPNNPYGQNPNNPYGQNPNNPYGQNPNNPYGQNPNNPYGQNPNNPYGQNPNNPYGQNPNNPYGQNPNNPYGQNPNNPYGQNPNNPYGRNPNNPYGQGNYTPPPYGGQFRRPQTQQRPLSVGLLVFSIINIVSGCCCVGSIFGIISLIFTLSARDAATDEDEIKKKKTALVLNIFGIIISVLTVVVYYVALINGLIDAEFYYYIQ